MTTETRGAGTPLTGGIASLLPGATEICFALGLGDRVVGVSHECDHPAAARGRPVLTAPSVDPHGSAADIDRAVRELVSRGLSIYRVDEARLVELAPELIVTQDACAVCAVPREQVEEAVRRLLGRETRVVSLAPLSLADVLGDIERVAEAAGIAERGREVAARCRQELDAIAAATAAFPRRRTLVLEWTSPPMPAGHWTPELVQIGGGDAVLSRDRRPTGAVPWDEIAKSAPEVVLVAPCGFTLEQTRREMPALWSEPAFANLEAVRRGDVWLADGNAYFNRPGPRLVDTARIVAAALHGERLGEAYRFGTEVLLRAER